VFSQVVGPENDGKSEQFRIIYSEKFHDICESSSVDWTVEYDGDTLRWILERQTVRLGGAWN